MNVYFQKTHQRGFGTYPLRGEACLAAIASALETGYRAFDTAQMYENESEVGEALANGGVPREQLCITTKVNVGNFAEERFIASVERSLKDLRIDYVDALMVHWPPVDGDIAPSLRQLQKAQQMGLARHIGISNYTSKMMRDAKAIVDAPLIANQVEFHPLLNQDVLLAAAVETGIPLSSYCSVARGKVFGNAALEQIAAGYDRSIAQVVLRWILQKGVTLNTMSTKPENIRANFDIVDFTLSSVDMARIDALTHANLRLVGANRQWD